MKLPLKTPPQSVCVLRLSAIGDVCHTVPAVRTLQTCWPETAITWIIGKTEAKLVGDLPGVEFIIFDKGAGWSAYANLYKQLRVRRFDWLLHMQASMRGNMVSQLIRARHRLGFDRARARDLQWLFTDYHIDAQPRQHVLEGLVSFAEKLTGKPRELVWNIPLSEADHAFAQSLIPDDKPTLIISPCTSQRFRNWRNWHVDRYVAVLNHAANRHRMRILLTGGNTRVEREYGEAITASVQHPVINLIGNTNLKQLLALISRATVLVSPDSGPAHMATTVGTPVIGLYATSNPQRTGPYLSQEWVANRYPDAVRAEFGRPVDELRWGQRVRDQKAMARITANDVTTKLDALMARRSDH
jgi:heptosyltransferase I